MVAGAAARMARMVAAKWPAPPSGRSSRSTEVMTTWARPSFATASATRSGSSAASGPGWPVRDVAEGAGAGAGVAHDHHGGVALRPALADVGAGGFLADRDEAVGAHQGAGLVVDRMGGRLYPDPGGLALDGVVRPVRLLRMARRGGAVVDDEAGGHGEGDVAGAGRGVKLCLVRNPVGMVRGMGPTRKQVPPTGRSPIWIGQDFRCLPWIPFSPISAQIEIIIAKAAMWTAPCRSV